MALKARPGYYRGYHVCATVAPDGETPVVAVSHRGAVIEWIPLADAENAEAVIAAAHANIDAWLDAR